MGRLAPLVIKNPRFAKSKRGWMKLLALLERKPILSKKLQASICNLRLIKDTTILRDFLQSLIYTVGRSVRSERGHGFDDVSYSQYPGLQHNLLTQ